MIDLLADQKLFHDRPGFNRRTITGGLIGQAGQPEVSPVFFDIQFASRQNRLAMRAGDMLRATIGHPQPMRQIHDISGGNIPLGILILLMAKKPARQIILAGNLNPFVILTYEMSRSHIVIA